jgi:hypothetical protein
VYYQPQSSAPFASCAWLGVPPLAKGGTDFSQKAGVAVFRVLSCPTLVLVPVLMQRDQVCPHLPGDPDQSHGFSQLRKRTTMIYRDAGARLTSQYSTFSGMGQCLTQAIGADQLGQNMVLTKTRNSSTDTGDSPSPCGLELC